MCQADYGHGQHAAERLTGAAIKQSTVPRSELFLTSKIPQSELGYNSTLRVAAASLAALGVEYLDLLLIHWVRMLSMSTVYLDHLEYMLLFANRDGRPLTASVMAVAAGGRRASDRGSGGLARRDVARSGAAPQPRQSAGYREDQRCLSLETLCPLLGTEDSLLIL